MPTFKIHLDDCLSITYRWISKSLSKEYLSTKQRINVVNRPQTSCFIMCESVISDNWGHLIDAFFPVLCWVFLNLKIPVFVFSERLGLEKLKSFNNLYENNQHFLAAYVCACFLDLQLILSTLMLLPCPSHLQAPFVKFPFKVATVLKISTLNKATQAQGYHAIFLITWRRNITESFYFKDRQITGTLKPPENQNTMTS